MTLSAHVISATAYTVAPYPFVAYTSNFDTAAARNWTLLNGSTYTQAASPHSSPYVLNTSNASLVDVATKSVTGLTIGAVYTLKLWAMAHTGFADYDFKVTVDGINNSTFTSISEVWTEFTHTFTATATNHTIRLALLEAGTIYFDDVTLTTPDFLISTLDVKSATVTIDEAWTPYIQASLTCWTPDEAALELLDPRESVRVTVELEQSFGDGAVNWNSTGFIAPKTFTADLLMMSREVDRDADEMTIGLCSDEQLLRNRALIATTPSSAALTYQSSVRSIVNNVVLSTIGATLEAGTADADFTVLSNATNLIVNPSSEVDLNNAIGAQATLTRSSVWANTGTYSFRLSSATTADSYLTVGGDSGALRNGMVAGKTYTASGTIYIPAALTGTAHTNGARQITVFTKVGAAAYVLTKSAQAPNTAGTTQRLSVTFTVPAGATEAFVRFYAGHPTLPSALYWDSLQLVEGTDALDYFDGSITDDARYFYQWTGTAHASTSTRVPASDRDGEALYWQPGVSAWDYIRPILEQSNLRLYNDENRDWRLIEGLPETAGMIQLGADSNVTKATDTISTEDSGEWFSGVVLTYKWEDGAGVSYVKYDAAGTGTKVYTRTIEHPWPGAGAAQAILDRSIGRGRVFDVDAVSDYTVRPGMDVVIELPDTPLQAGKIASVEWTIPANSMRISSRGLTDTSATAWMLATGSWSAQPVGTDWTEYAG